MREGDQMIQTEINFEELVQKTSIKFVEDIKFTVNHVKDTWDNKGIQFFIEEDQYTLTVLMCFEGNLQKHRYRFETGTIDKDNIWWVDIRKFFDIPYEMKAVN